MKICFIIDSLRFGGAQKVTYDLVSSLEKLNDVDIDLVTYFKRFEIGSIESIHHKNVKILGLSRASYLSYTDAIMYKLFGRFYQYFMSDFYTRSLMNKVDFSSYDKVVLVSDSSFFPFHKLKEYHDEVIFVLHSLKSSQYLSSKFKCINSFKRKLVTKVFSKVNIISVSNGIKDDVIREFNVRSDRIKNIYNLLPVDDIILKSKGNLDFSLKERILNHGYICHVGRHSKEKRIDILLKSFKVLVDNGFEEKLVLIGDGPERAHLYSMANELGLHDNVIFLGFVSNPYVLIANAKCLVLSSEREGLPTVLLEALFLGTPVVSTNCESGPDEILTGRLKPYLSKVNNSEDLSWKIMSVLSEEYPEIEISNEFFNEIIVNKWLEILND